MANTSTWLSISTMSGSSGQTILTVNAAPNLTSSAKTAVVKAYNPVYNISATTQVTIAQYSPSIEVSPTMVGVPDTGGTYQLSISANCSYFITYPELVTNYSTTAATGDTTITFRVPSTSADTTLVGNIVITDTSGQVSKLVRIEQYGAGAHIYYSPSAITIPYSGGAATFSVTADCIYNITKGSGDWYTVIPQTGYTGVTVFTVSSNTANTGATDWTSSITIVGPYGNVGTVAVTQSKMPVVVQIPYTADTSTVDASGETRVITIDTTGLVPSSITVDIEGASGATYTYDNGIITVTFPENTGTERDITVIVNGQTTGGDDAAAVITFPQAEYTTVQIPYTADTSTVDASGETRFIYIDTTGLIESSITISVEGATGITYSYSNGVITVIFPPYYDGRRDITVNVYATTVGGNNAIASIHYVQRSTAGVNDYLTIIIHSGTVIGWIASNSSYTRTIEYRKNGGEWTSITSTRAGTSIGVEAGDILEFKGNNKTYSNGSDYNGFGAPLTAETRYSIEGNIMSLIDSEDFSSLTSFESANTFSHLFCCVYPSSYSSPIQSVVSAKNLVLPATSLTSNCYESMFANIGSLTEAPSILPATTLASNCYNSMFYACTGLTTVPKLSATNLSGAIYCYSEMFRYCTSLIQAPELPATTLAKNCYSYMFYNCTSLTQAPVLPATTLANGCYQWMFGNCTSLTQAPELPATNLDWFCYQSMFQNCTSLTQLPELPATTLATGCYELMFANCTSLVAIPNNYLPATDLTVTGNAFSSGRCYNAMFKGCTSLTIVPTLPATTLTTFCYQSMFQDCVNLAAAPALPATILQQRCYSEMFRGCTSLTTAPELPATTLTNNCYSNMFNSCTSLNYIKCLATNPSSSYTSAWVSGVAASGTFIKDSSTTWSTGTSGIPSGWTVQDA